MLVPFVAKGLKCVQPLSYLQMLFPNWLALIKLISLPLPSTEKGSLLSTSFPVVPFSTFVFCPALYKSVVLPLFSHPSLYLLSSGYPWHLFLPWVGAEQL